MTKRLKALIVGSIIMIVSVIMSMVGVSKIPVIIVMSIGALIMAIQGYIHFAIEYNKDKWRWK